MEEGRKNGEGRKEPRKVKGKKVKEGTEEGDGKKVKEGRKEGHLERFRTCCCWPPLGGKIRRAGRK